MFWAATNLDLENIKVYMGAIIEDMIKKISIIIFQESGKNLNSLNYLLIQKFCNIRERIRLFSFFDIHRPNSNIIRLNISVILKVLVAK